jgi:hypothetical protein
MHSTLGKGSSGDVAVRIRQPRFHALLTVPNQRAHEPIRRRRASPSAHATGRGNWATRPASQLESHWPSSSFGSSVGWSGEPRRHLCGRRAHHASDGGVRRQRSATSSREKPPHHRKAVAPTSPLASALCVHGMILCNWSGFCCSRAKIRA